MEANMNMDRFIRSQNVSRYRRLIESVSEYGSVTNETKRQTIFNLFAEEQQKQKDAGDPIYWTLQGT
jgi:hypothetical protein